jgi:hypothetical protein
MVAFYITVRSAIALYVSRRYSVVLRLSEFHIRSQFARYADRKYHQSFTATVLSRTKQPRLDTSLLTVNMDTILLNSLIHRSTLLTLLIISFSALGYNPNEKRPRNFCELPTLLDLSTRRTPKQTRLELFILL